MKFDGSLKTLDLLPVLCRGRTFASFHILGTFHFPNKGDFSCVSGAPVDEAVSFSICALTPSGHVAFDVSSII